MAFWMRLAFLMFDIRWFDVDVDGEATVIGDEMSLVEVADLVFHVRGGCIYAIDVRCLRRRFNPSLLN